MKKITPFLIFFFFLKASAWEQMTGSLPIDSEEYYSYPQWTAPDLPELKGERLLLTEYMPEVGSQGRQGSCTAWAIGYAAMSYLEAVRRGREPDGPDRLYSPSYIFNQIAFIKDGKEHGSLIVDGLNLLRDQGVPTIADFEYTDENFTRAPSVEVRVKARDNRLFEFGRLTNAEGMKSALRAGLPVVIAIQTSPQFQGRSDTFEVYNAPHFERGQQEWETLARQKGISPKDFMHHLHAMAVVGYDDAKRAFLVINSWGKDWGIQSPEELRGYCWMSYDLFQRIGPSPNRFCRQAWVLDNGRGKHPRSLKALQLKEEQLKVGVILDSTSWKDRDNGYGWELYVSSFSPRESNIESVTWEVQKNRQPEITVTRPADGDGLAVRGTSNRVGEIPFRAIVAFNDGSRTILKDKILVIEPADYLQDRFRVKIDDEYYGRVNGKPTWVWVGWIEGDKKHFSNVTRVNWQWNVGGSIQTRSTSDPEYDFDVEGQVHGPTLVKATVELSGGQKVSPIGLVELFSQQEDELRLQISPTVGHDGWGVLLNLFGPLMERERITKAVYHFPAQYGGSQTVTDDSGWGDFNHEIDQMTRSESDKPEPFTIRLDLHFEDGAVRTLSGDYVPYDEY